MFGDDRYWMGRVVIRVVQRLSFARESTSFTTRLHLKFRY